MTFAQRRNRQTTHFSERIPLVKRRISVFELFHPFPNSTHNQLLPEKFSRVDPPTCLDSKQTIRRQSQGHIMTARSVGLDVESLLGSSAYFRTGFGSLRAPSVMTVKSVLLQCQYLCRSYISACLVCVVDSCRAWGEA